MRGTKFWVSMAVFQVAFGLTVFAFTRQHYIDLPVAGRAVPATTRDATSEWLDSISASNPALSGVPASISSNIEDPFEISRQANEYFSSQQYPLAADLYEKLLKLDPDNVDVYNNLGLTLHYVGRSTEALQRLTEGVAVDPSYQRIWLTLGYVNSQVGNVEKAREALTTAVDMDSTSQVGQSASTMLQGLPPAT